MFDLIEEDLKTEEVKPLVQESETMRSPEVGEIAVSVMPERFRPVIKKKKKGSVAMIVVIVLFVLIAIASIVALLILSQPQKKESTPPEQKSETSVQEAPTQEPSQAESATSTQAVVPFAPPENTQAQPPPPQAVTQEPIVPAQPSLSLIQGIDTDGDLLTDQEERMYTTDALKPDTDGDGYFDGEELKKLFDPTKPTPARIDTSSLVHSYSNQPFKYRIVYPSAWVAKAVNTTEREVILTSATGEFISLKVEDNPQNLSPLDWYITTKDPGTNPSQLQTTVGETWSGVASSDGRTLYFVRRSDKGSAVSAPIMYSLSYNLNTKNEVNFLATFQMMIYSITFRDLTFIK